MHGSEVRGLLPPLLLLLVHERPGHGYELISRLAGLGMPDIEPGQIYRTLRGLERERRLVSVWVTSASGPARRHYELTADGLADLEARMARLTRLGDVLDTCLTRWRSGGRPVVAGPAGRRGGQRARRADHTGGGHANGRAGALAGGRAGGRPAAATGTRVGGAPGSGAPGGVPAAGPAADPLAGQAAGRTARPQGVRR
jgi:PadR family transcriptional regulator, regulatory protein PadR